MQEFKIKVTLIALGIILAVDLYSWHALNVLFFNKNKKRKQWFKFIWWGISILAISLLIGANFIPSIEKNMQARVYIFAFIIIVYISKSIISVFVLIDDLRRAMIWLSRLMSKYLGIPKESTKKPETFTEPIESKISRSEFLTTAGTLTAGVPLILLTKGIFKGGYDYRIHRVPLYIKNLPSAFNRLKIVQLSDIHTGSLLDIDAVKKGVDMVNAEQADLVFFTGDLVNNETKEAYTYGEMFSTIKGKMGVYSILGNHDYGDYVKWDSAEAKKENLDNLVKHHHNLGWHLLRNEHVVLNKGESKLAIMGVENWGNKGRFQKFGNVDLAKRGVPEDAVKLMLSHDPSHFDDIISTQHNDIDVTFSGHTHGMQFGIEIGKFKWSPSQYIYPHWAGLYEVNGTRLYVNRGFGFLGYPGRVGILPEITVFELKPFAG